MFVDGGSFCFACCDEAPDFGSQEKWNSERLGSEVSPCKSSPHFDACVGSVALDNTSVPSCRGEEAPELVPDKVCTFGSPSFDPWTSMQDFSFSRWCRSLPFLALRTRTPFAAFLRKTLHTTRLLRPAPASALFPLPLPKHGVFDGLPPRVSSRRRRKVEFDRAFHVLVCALNFLHADFNFPSVELMCRVPSEPQLTALRNLRVMLKAFGSSGETFSVPQSGRRSVHLLAGLDDLSRFVTLHGLSSEPYRRGFGGFSSGEAATESSKDGVRLQPDLSRAEELRPYRPLEPGRLKLSGRANWDPQPFLGDHFLIPFLEPDVLLWSSTVESSDVPDLSKEDPATAVELARIWDINGLAKIYPAAVDSMHSDTCIRCFACYKSATVDRQIVDRRGRNSIEVAMPGPSRYLPTGASLSVLEVDPRRTFVSASVSDRKDFYHQLKVSDQRAYTNLVWPPVPFSSFDGLCASDDLKKKCSESKSRRREEVGDFLKTGKVVKPKLPQPDSLVHLAFASMGQGDHLGVEVATQCHREFLISQGLLSPSRELVSSEPWKGSCVLEGLVIDDFFAISIERCGLGPPKPQKSVLVPFPDPGEFRRDGGSTSSDLISKATKCYDSAGLLGSPEKDVVGSRVAKVAGAELNSSPELCSQGIVSLAAPAKKRMALSLVSLCLSSLEVTSDALHTCVIGGWISLLMFRRPLMSVLFHSHSLVDVNALDSDRPRVIGLPRRVAQELTLLAILSPLMMSDLSAPIQKNLYASDSSDAKGAYVKTTLGDDMARFLWRSGSKKGGYARLQTRAEALAKKLEVGRETVSLDFPHPAVAIKKPMGLRYDFIEVCGGAAKVSAFMSKEGWVVGPCLDLDRSPHFDLSSLTLIRWLLHLVETGALDSFFVQPPCTTFSPAAYPALRSYKLPRGFSPSEKRTKLGTTLALRALCLMFVSSRCGVIGLLEQSRRSKMAWLPEWLWLVEHGLASEEWLASCMYGSPHQKEFRLLGVNIDMSGLHRACDRSHKHIVIQGKYTRPSATYTDELAFAFSLEISKALRRKKVRDVVVDVDVTGLESAVFNDVVLGSRWSVCDSWKWKRPAHINIHETASVVRLLKEQALTIPKSRFSVGIDSHVALSALAKGRTPSFGLRPVVRRAGATCIAGCLYPSYHFSPTRYNPSDCPTRDVELPLPSGSSFADHLDLDGLHALARVSGLKRFAANWSRLVCLLLGGSFGWHSSGTGSWRFLHYAKSAYPFLWISSAVRKGRFDALDFDKTLGYPGEGHALLRFFWILSSCAPPSPILDFSIALCHHLSGPAETSKPDPFWGVRFSHRHGGLAHAVGLDPRDNRDRARASGRNSIELDEGRPVLERTRAGRDRLVSAFSQWLVQQGLSIEIFLDSAVTDIDMVNLLLGRYGRELFKAGRPYGHYSELINGIAAMRPRFRRSLQGAWDLAYTWLRHEPPRHHQALPWQPLVALLVTSFVWGWYRVAGVLALSWGAISRIGEVLAADRRQLVLPSDLGDTVNYALLQIEEPKTRHRGARHQVARLDQPELLKILEVVFAKLPGSARLWPFSPQTLRKRFYSLLQALELPVGNEAEGGRRGIDLGSLRAGGATWLLEMCESSEFVRRRGRWISSKIMEIYIQEASSAQFLPMLAKQSKEKILLAVHLFPRMLRKLSFLHAANIPENAWRFLILSDRIEQGTGS